MDNNINKDWNQPGTWAEELVEQSESRAKHWFKVWIVTMIVWIVTFMSLIGTNAYWIHVFQSYDYVNQNGSGINSINTGHQEDIQYYGAESENEEKSQEK